MSSSSTAHENSLATTASEIPAHTAAPIERPELPEGWLAVESMDIDAQGIAHRPDGKVVFIEGALPFEVVSTSVHRKKNNWEAGVVTAIHKESAQRVRPGCPNFGLHAGACGGCKMQHMHESAQVAVKQRVLEDNLWHLGKVKPETLLRPIAGPAWGYRYRARLSVRHVHKKGEVLIGFHERKSRYVADMKECHVLPPHVSAMLMPLREMIFNMDARETLPQIELAVAENAIALVFRVLDAPSDADRERLIDFGVTNDCRIYLQTGGLDTVTMIHPTTARESLYYTLPEFDIRIDFEPVDFVQVNSDINQRMVHFAIEQLRPGPDHRVLDLFCGIGNFSLPLAQRSGTVLGIEGDKSLVTRAAENAKKNALDNVEFRVADLSRIEGSESWLRESWDRVLLDPARSGAAEVVALMKQLNPERIVYVSCHPGTLARDAGVLVHEHGYILESAGIIDMFPHTAHVESIAVFRRK